VVGDRLNVGLSKAQIEQAPSWDTDKPVSRQHEIAYSRYYDYPYYWTGPARWGLGWDPLMGAAPVSRPDPVEEEILARERESADVHLHSARDVIGYYVQAADDDVGHVEDFLVDDRTWAIRYIVVDTRNWLPGRKVVISPGWIKTVSWHDSRVYVDLLRKEVETAPEYDSNTPLERALESGGYEHYCRPTHGTRSDRGADFRPQVKRPRRARSAPAPATRSLLSALVRSASSHAGWFSRASFRAERH
jgi:hypothetical protein